MLPNGEMNIPKKEVLTKSEVPWLEIWDKVRNLAVNDELERSNIDLPSAKDELELTNDIRKKGADYRLELEKHLEIPQHIPGQPMTPLELAVKKSVLEYKAKAWSDSRLKLYEKQANVSLPLLQEFESYLDNLNVWKYKFTTKWESGYEHTPEIANLDSSYYMGADGTTLRLKKSNILSEGIAGTVQSPAHRTFFASETYYKNFENEILDNHRFVAPKHELALMPILDFHPIEIFTQPFRAYIKGESNIKPSYQQGIHVGTSDNPKEHIYNWNISIHHPLAFIGAGGKDPYHEGDVVNSITQF